jgi:hypothetical protein
MWFQRAKEKDLLLLQGDALTSCFMKKASGRKREKYCFFESRGWCDRR